MDAMTEKVWGGGEEEGLRDTEKERERDVRVGGNLERKGAERWKRRSQRGRAGCSLTAGATVSAKTRSGGEAGGGGAAAAVAGRELMLIS